MGEKTQKPSPHKLKEARKRGEVAKSREAVALASYFAILAVLWAGGDFMLRKLFAIIDRALVAPGMESVQPMLISAAWVVLPVLLLAIGAAVIMGIIQTRGIFSFHPLIPKFEHINPGKGLKNLFSTRQLFELAKTVIKVLLLTAALTWCAAIALDAMVKMIYSPAADLLRTGASIGFSLMKWAAVVYAVSAAMDYAHQHYEFMKQQRMSIEEMRRELREEEGDPLIKGGRRATAREVVYSDQSGSRSDKQKPTPRTV